MQIVIDANTRLAVAVGRPVPGNPGDCTAYRTSGAKDACEGAHVMIDDGYQGNHQVIMPYRNHAMAPNCPNGKPAQHHPQTGTRPRRARLRPHEVLEYPAELPPQTRRRLPRTHGIALMRNLAKTI